MKTKEVGVEDWSEADLLDDNLGQDRDKLGPIVEVVVQKHEPESEGQQPVNIPVDHCCYCCSQAASLNCKLTKYRTEC